jgi:hypothetical protein
MRPSSIPLLAAALLPSTGCCSLARLFCGPDKTPWVSVDHSDPKLAVRTLLEALRRDDPQRVYDSLSSDHRRRLGLDSAKIHLAWARVREQYPYLHVAGYADVPDPVMLGPDAARVELSIAGEPVSVQLVRTTQWFVHYRLPAFDQAAPQRVDPRRLGELVRPGNYVQRPAELFRLTPHDSDQKSTLELRRIEFLHPGLDEVPEESIEAAGMRREWKVDAIARLELPAAP